MKTVSVLNDFLLLTLRFHSFWTPVANYTAILARQYTPDSLVGAPTYFIARREIKYRYAVLKATVFSALCAPQPLKAVGKCSDVENLWWIALQFIGLLNQRV